MTTALDVLSLAGLIIGLAMLLRWAGVHLRGRGLR